MTIQWDLLLPTKKTLIRERDPTIADAHYDYSVIWVNKLTNSAWLLKDSTMQVLPPTTGTVVDVATADTTTLTELEAQITSLESEMDTTIKSEPTSGEYQIDSLRLDADKHIVVKFDEDAES